MISRKIEFAIVVVLLSALGVSAGRIVLGQRSEIKTLRKELGNAGKQILEQQGYIETLEKRPEQVPEEPPGTETVFSGGGSIQGEPEIRYRTKYVKADCPETYQPAEEGHTRFAAEPLCECREWVLEPRNLFLDDWQIDVKRPTASETAYAAFSGVLGAHTPLGPVTRPFDASEALEWSYAPPPACPEARRFGWTVGAAALYSPLNDDRVSVGVGAMWGIRVGK